MPDEDSGYESWDFEEDADGGFIPDQICSGYHDANLPIWDPRDYFLMVIKVRATEIMNEWRHLIRAVEHGILVCKYQVSTYRNADMLDRDSPKRLLQDYIVKAHVTFIKA